MNRSLPLLPAMTLAAALPAGVDHWTGQQVREHEQQLVGKVKDGLASEVLGKWGNHSVMLIHRAATGQSEFHENQADIIIVRAGGGEIVLGGSIEAGKTTAPGEIRGAGIQNGEKQALHVGDIVDVPPKTPHQVILSPGQTIDYITVKVDAQ